MSQVFHPGELAVQQRAKSPDTVQVWAQRMMRSTLDDQARLFFSQLPFVVLSARDASERPWATLLAGEPGFAWAESDTTLRVSVRPDPDEPWGARLAVGGDVGLLGIEFHSRRRNRLNGVVTGVDKSGITVGVRQSYGNCPKYITPRAARPSARLETRGPARWGKTLGHAQRAAVGAADTFFIASGAGKSVEGCGWGMDVSHRGGAPGFVVVDDEHTMLFPDYAGNNMFNTFGNLHTDPRAGLVFVDFESGDLLHMTGHAEVVWDAERRESFPGAQRLVRFVLDEFVSRPRSVPLQFARVPTTHGAPLAP